MATFTYTVDGKEYKGKQKFNQMVSKGDTFNIEVYKNSKGDYKIYKKTGVLGYVLYYISLIVGAVLFVASVVSLIPKKNGKKSKSLKSVDLIAILLTPLLFAAKRADKKGKSFSGGNKFECITRI